MVVERIVFPSFLDKLTMSEPQARFLCDDSPLKILNCGRFGGKSFFSLLDVVYSALKLFAERKQNLNWWRPGPLVTVGIFAPTEKNQVTVWPALCDLVPKIGGETNGYSNTTVRQDAKEVFLFGLLGIQFQLVSCWQPDGIRGAGYDIVFVDEAAQLKGPNVYFRVISPLVARANYYGKIILASTPLNNFWDKWVQSALEKKGRFKNFNVHHWTCWENPRLEELAVQEVLATREDNIHIYLQEFEARLFVQLPPEEVLEGEHVFDRSHIEELYVDDFEEINGPFAVGLDLAWSGDDEAVLTVIDIPTGIVCHIEIFPKTTDPELINIMDKAKRQWNNPDIYIDRTGGRARAFAENIPPSISYKPVILRRGQDNGKSEFVISKHLLFESLTKKMNFKKVRFPNPDTFEFERLPWAREQDQEANFRQLYSQMLASKRITIRKANGNLEYQYKADPSYDRNHRYRSGDDNLDSLLLAARGLPTVIEEHVSLEDFENRMMRNLI